MGGNPAEPGHNSSGAPVEWSRWTKKRVFVRALEGTYGQLKEELFTQPRVYSSKKLDWHGGQQVYHKPVINPQENKIAQQIECHLDTLAPGGYGVKHGHMNSAVFFVLKGKGHDVHDTVHLPWEAGDALIVENGCVHQHFNDDPDNEAIVVVMKAKPLFLFMHMIFQKNVNMPPAEASAKQAAYTPPEEI
jgi:gentisate 1,2-dioxygenase